jgi:predicted P-loop ATPase/GTPase
MRFTILTILTFVVATSFGQNSKDSLQFSIYFASGFNRDSLSLQINNTNIFENKFATTDLSDGITNIHIYQNQNNLRIWKDKKLPPLKFKDLLVLDIKLNGRLEKVIVDLSNGKYVLIDKCVKEVNCLNNKELTVTQLKRQPHFY